MDRRILIIEDEKSLGRFLELELCHEGYQVEVVHDGREGLTRALDGGFDLVLLDVMLPSLNGMEILRRLRQSSQVLVIMLTAKDDITDKVMGLDLGADDYLAKPFAIEELLARIRVAFKHREVVEKQGINKGQELSYGLLMLDTVSREVQYDGKTIELTKKEFDLLEYLLKNKQIVLTRENIVSKVWGYDFTGDTNIVDVYIRYLRSKIDDTFDCKLIHTVRGVGYVIKDEENNSRN